MILSFSFFSSLLKLHPSFPLFPEETCIRNIIYIPIESRLLKNPSFLLKLYEG